MPQRLTARTAAIAGLGAVALLAGALLHGQALPASRDASLASGQLSPQSHCQRALLNRRPGWSTSAAWNGSNELVVIDQIYNQALRYTAAGESLGTIPDVAAPGIEAFFPITVKAASSGLAFELSGNYIRALDHGYSFVKESRLGGNGTYAPQAQGRGGSWQITSMWLWQPVGKDDVVAFSDLKSLNASEAGGNSYRVAFVRFPIDSPSKFEILGKAMTYDASSPPCPSASCDSGTALRLYNRLGHDYIASIGDAAFILKMDEMKIYRQAHAGADLEALPVNFAELAQRGLDQPAALPKFYSRSDFRNLMAKVEISTMPTGIYAWNNSLFVTARIFDGTATRWTVTRIDAATGQILGTATIPTSANHLTIAPGAAQWAFIEKGPAKGWSDNQEIPSILFVPSKQFDKNLSGDLCSD